MPLNSSAQPEIEVVESDRANADNCLAWLWNGIRNVSHRQLVEATMLANQNRFHCAADDSWCRASGSGVGACERLSE
jgi:hypothetical protein